MASLINNLVQSYLSNHQANNHDGNNNGIFGSGPMDWLTNAAMFAGTDAFLNRFDEDQQEGHHHQQHANFDLLKNAGLAGALALGYQYWKNHQGQNQQQVMDPEQAQQLIAAAQQQQQQQQPMTPSAQPPQQAMNYYYPQQQQQEYMMQPPPPPPPSMMGPSQLSMVPPQMPPQFMLPPGGPMSPFMPPQFNGNGYMNNPFGAMQQDPYTMMFINNILMQQQQRQQIMMQQQNPYLGNGAMGPMTMAPYFAQQHQNYGQQHQYPMLPYGPHNPYMF